VDHCGLIPGSGRDYFSSQCGQTGSVAHPASYWMGTGISFTRGKVAGAWSWPLTST